MVLDLGPDTRSAMKLLLSTDQEAYSDEHPTPVIDFQTSASQTLEPRECLPVANHGALLDQKYGTERNILLIH